MREVYEDQDKKSSCYTAPRGRNHRGSTITLLQEEIACDSYIQYVYSYCYNLHNVASDSQSEVVVIQIEREERHSLEKALYEFLCLAALPFLRLLSARSGMSAIDLATKT